MNKKLFIETIDGFQMIPVDNLYFKTDNLKGRITASQNLNHAYEIEILKVPIGIYNDLGKRKVMRRLFITFMNAIEACNEVLTIEQSRDGVLYFKDGQEVLKTFNPETQQFAQNSVHHMTASEYIREIANLNL